MRVASPGSPMGISAKLDFSGEGEIMGTCLCMDGQALCPGLGDLIQAFFGRNVIDVKGHPHLLSQISRSPNGLPLGNRRPRDPKILYRGLPLPYQHVGVILTDIVVLTVEAHHGAHPLSLRHDRKETAISYSAFCLKKKKR